MKKLKTIKIEFESHIDENYNLVIDEKSGNFEEVYEEVKEYFGPKYISSSVQDNIVKKRYNRTVDDSEKEVLTEIKMPIFTKACEENLKETKVELAQTISMLNTTSSKLSKTELKLESTNSELRETKVELKSTNSKLKSTDSELKSTISMLNTTNSELSKTKTKLESTNSELAELKRVLKANGLI